MVLYLFASTCLRMYINMAHIYMNRVLSRHHLSRNAFFRESHINTLQCLQLELYSQDPLFRHAGLTVTLHLYSHYAGTRTELFLSLA